MTRLRRVGFSMLLGVLPALITAGEQRNYISIAGSTLVYPFSGAVIERLVQRPGFETPRIQVTGDGEAFALFCSGAGGLEPDIAYASRRIDGIEYDRCQANGVDEIVEIKIGYGGIVLAGSKEMPVMFLGRDDIYKGLGREVPDPDGEQALVPNPYPVWKAANVALPRRSIRVLGPAADSGAHYIFTHLAVEAGCRSFGWLRDLEKDDPLAYRKACRRIRDDSYYVTAGDDDAVKLDMLLDDPQALAVFGFGFVEQHHESLHAMAVDGVLPTLQTIGDHTYPLSRPLYLYVKKQHVGRIPGMRALIAEFTGETAWGNTGYLVDAGLVPMPARERERYARDAAELQPMTRP